MANTRSRNNVSNFERSKIFQPFLTHRHRSIQQNRGEHQERAQNLVPRNHLKIKIERKMNETNRSVQKSTIKWDFFWDLPCFAQKISLILQRPPTWCSFIFGISVSISNVSAQCTRRQPTRWTSAAREVRSPRCYGQSFFLEGCHHEVVVYIWL